MVVSRAGPKILPDGSPLSAAVIRVEEQSACFEATLTNATCNHHRLGVVSISIRQWHLRTTIWRACARLHAGIACNDVKDDRAVRGM
jgi:hypothetical protein